MTTDIPAAAELEPWLVGHRKGMVDTTPKGNSSGKFPVMIMLQLLDLGREWLRFCSGSLTMR